jgi:diacylglycerol O-acyltransferase
MQREKMSAVDTAWLRMDSDANQMMIVGVAMLRKPVAVAQLKDALASRFLSHRRFRSQVVHDLAGAWWQEVEVDLDNHVIHTKLASPANGAAGRPHPGGSTKAADQLHPHGSNKPALQALVGELSRQPLDPALPLWQMHLVDGCVGADGQPRQALVIRIHHCIADGVALVGVFMSMFDSSADAPAFAPQGEASARARQDRAASPAAPQDEAWAAFLKYAGMMSDLDNLPLHLSKLGLTAGQLALDAIRLSAMEEDSPTRLKGKPGGIKHVAWSEPLPFHEVKAISKAYGCSINDVLMSSVAGAIRSYLVHKGDQVDADCDVRAMVPVNLRKPAQQGKLGNAFGLVPLVLPVGIENPVARLYEVHERMNELKGSMTALVAMTVLGVLGATPKQVQTEVQGYFSRKATAVMSNVPGPQAPLFLAGSQLDQCMFWVPQSGDIGIGVSILSYNGGVQFGIVTDDALVSDPEQIIARFAPEFEKLVLLALMSEW